MTERIQANFHHLSVLSGHMVSWVTTKGEDSAGGLRKLFLMTRATNSLITFIHISSLPNLAAKKAGQCTLPVCPKRKWWTECTVLSLSQKSNPEFHVSLKKKKKKSNFSSPTFAHASLVLDSSSKDMAFWMPLVMTERFGGPSSVCVYVSDYLWGIPCQV